MDRKEKEERAMMRYSAITPLLHADIDEKASMKRLLEEQAGKLWPLPDGSFRKYSARTIERWYYLYRQNGLDALKENSRRDEGNFRVLPESVISEIDALYEKHHRIKSSTIIRLLRLQGVIDGKTPSSSTIYRYLRLRNKAEKAALDATEKRAFEAPYSNNLWQTDIMYLNHLIPTRGKDGKHRKKQAYLVAIIDDHSRLLCHGEFYFSQNLLAYLDCLKKAVQKRGCFERIYCDNGQVFLSSQVKRIAAKMGSMVLHCKPNQASSKGKIEKFFRSVREQFLDECYATDFPKTLEELNKRFSKWCEETYNVRNHSGIGNAPVKKWMETSHKIKLMPPLKIDEAFTFEAERRVKSDGTFSLDGKTFETYGALAGKKVLVSYDPFFPETAHVSHDGKNFGKANLLDKKFNASKPRKKLTEGN